jgi:ABC-type antimicrobial peptide transport system permease subunit
VRGLSIVLLFILKASFGGKRGQFVRQHRDASGWVTQHGVPAGIRQHVAGSPVACGIRLALALGRLVENQLFALKGTDPAVMVAAAAMIATIAVLAGYLPARRAAQIDPVHARRFEASEIGSLHRLSELPHFLAAVSTGRTRVPAVLESESP